MIGTMTTASVARASSRIVAFDLLRGFFLLVVIIDHVELFPSGYDLISGRGQLWVSAAEGFFFLSGLLVGLIYRKKLAQGLAFVFKKLWSRAALLYVCSVSLTLLFTAWALAHGNAEAIKYAAATHLGWDTVWDTLRLKYVYGWSDFLSYYVMFMVAAPLALVLLKKRLWWLMVAICFFIWLHRGTDFSRAWQVLFFGGMMAGYYWHQIQALVAGWSRRTQTIASRVVIGAAGTTIVLSYLNLFVLDTLHKRLASMPGWLADFIWNWDRINEQVWLHFDKWTMPPARIAMFLLWFAAGYLLVNRYSHKIPGRIRWGLTLLGQNSLYVYGMHSIFVFAVHAYLPKNLGIPFNFAITTVVIAIMVGITYGKNVLKSKTLSAGPFRLVDGRLAMTRTNP